MRRSVLSRSNRGQSELAASRKRARIDFRTIRQASRAPRNIPVSTASHRRLAAQDFEGFDRLDPFFRAWELAGNYPAILDDAALSAKARATFSTMRRRCSTRLWPNAG